MYCSELWGTVADWVVGVGTLALAALAIWGETIRGLIYRPEFTVSCTGEPPDCISIPIADGAGNVISDSIYLRILVANVGRAAANTVEVYARRLRVQRANGTWMPVSNFPHMNLKWANTGAVYNRLVPGMAKHCDVAHITDPPNRPQLRENAPQLNPQQTALVFELMVRPNNRTHIVGPGQYQLDIQVAAKNARPVERTLEISLTGTWYPNEAQMLSSGIGISVQQPP